MCRNVFVFLRNDFTGPEHSCFFRKTKVATLDLLHAIRYDPEVEAGSRLLRNGLCQEQQRVIPIPLGALKEIDPRLRTLRRGQAPEVNDLRGQFSRVMKLGVEGDIIFRIAGTDRVRAPRDLPEFLAYTYGDHAVALLIQGPHDLLPQVALVYKHEPGPEALLLAGHFLRNGRNGPLPRRDVEPVVHVCFLIQTVPAAARLAVRRSGLYPVPLPLERVGRQRHAASS